MAYRRPGITVIQEFIGLIPALAPFALPSVSVGSVYQLVDDDLLGNFSATLQTYAYASLLAGAVVDLAETASDEKFTATKKEIGCVLKEAEVQIEAESLLGAADDINFSDDTTNRFNKALGGDLIVIKEQLAIEIVAAQTNGVSSDTPGVRDRLTAGTAGQFSQIKEGDTVSVTGGTNAVVSTPTVLAKISDDVLKLSSEINDGGGASTDTAFSIAGDRGSAAAGSYRIKTVTDVNNVVLEGEIPKEAPLKYTIKREVAEIELDRVPALPANGFLPSSASIQLPAALTHTIGAEDFSILSGKVYGSYRGLRNDMAGNVREFAKLSDLQSFFGIDQITPQSPLAYGLSVMLSNTVTPVNGLGLDENAVSNETLSFINAFDKLGQTQMYAIAILTQNPVIHQLAKTHVEGFSAAGKKKERVALVNRTLMLEQIEKDEATTSVEITNSRIIVNTQVDGASDFGVDAKILNDATTDQFLTVEKGDTLVVVSGTNAVVGNHIIDAVGSVNDLTTETDLVTSGAAIDISYYIIRKDGLGADGITFYDRAAAFIADLIVPGYYVRFLDGLTGSHKITGVLSDKKIKIEQVPGVTSLTSGLKYEIFRDLSKTEQAEFVKGYSSSIGSRRVANLWPDVLEGPVGAVQEKLPGFYGSCAIAAMTTGLPTQQGFTNLSISGFLGLEHSSGYFSDDQLDIIADGGTFILAQDGDGQPLYVRHQLTTDRSAIKFQEYSVTKNVDFIAKFLRNAYKDFSGVYNIVDSAKDDIKSTAKASLTFLKDDTRLPKIGGVIRDGKLSKLEESETQIDTLLMRFKLNIPIPLNNLDITIEV